MASGLVTAELRNQLHVLAGIGVVGDLPDSQLLGLVMGGHDLKSKAAFTALVQRHGPMVLGICRQVLGDTQDAEDAFQATFLVLARKAGSVRKADSLASWLHGVALRVSARTRVNTARRRCSERQAAAMRTTSAQNPDAIDQSWPELHEEIARLPGRYREPLVLCYLQGLTTEAAADRLRCPRGTILSRLSRARDRLRERLKRRGLAPMGVLAIQAPDTVFRRQVLSERLLSATLDCVAPTVAGSTAAAPAATTVISLAEGVLRTMYWAKVKTAFLWGLGTAALLAGVGTTLAFQDPRGKNQAPPQVQAIAATKVEQVDDPSSAIFVPLPAKAQLTRLLQQAADEAIALAKEHPQPASWTLTSIATVQAKVRDTAGAKATFAIAAREASGELGGNPNPHALWRVGHFQAESGLKDEAKESLRIATKKQPGVVGNFNKDSWTVSTYSEIIKDQANIGAPGDARETATRMLDFARKFYGSSNVGNARSVDAPKIASALAAAGDFDAAFSWSEGVQNRGNVLGEIALAASKSLARDEARRFVHEVAGRLVTLTMADETYFGLSDLAEARARIGEVEGAKASALAIGTGPSRVDYDMTDGQAYAMFRIAFVQREAGDHAGARETLREGFRTVNDHRNMRGRDGRFFQVAEAQIVLNDIDGAQKSVNAMSDPTQGQRPKVLAMIAFRQAEAGKGPAARATLRKALADAGLAVETLPAPDPVLANVPGVSQNIPANMRASLAEIQAMAGDVRGALKTLRSIDNPVSQQMTLRSVAEARAMAGDLAGALQLIKAESKSVDERRWALEAFGRGIDSRLSMKSLEARSE